MPFDVIIAPATASGVSAIAVIRLSGSNSIKTTEFFFQSKSNKKLSLQKSHTIHFGTLIDEEAEIIDEVLVSIFKNPHSYTGEDTVEISCHGSPVVVQRIIHLFLKNGVRFAEPGEFTRRAFLNGKLDLIQAEAVADLIHSESEAARKASINQMRGGFSNKIKEMRQQLIDFAALIELELDFSEEDVEFANRQKLNQLLDSLTQEINQLSLSFQVGNAVKNGIPTVIAGKPNAGKSTLLNALLEEEKAIVSEIPGTTRDFIEDVINISGVQFRIIDTAGLRQTEDQVEKIGIERTLHKMNEASLILFMVDLTAEFNPDEIENQLNEYQKEYIIVGNKMDQAESKIVEEIRSRKKWQLIQAKHPQVGIKELKEKMLKLCNPHTTDHSIFVNARHLDLLGKISNSLILVKQSLASQISGEMLALDIRLALNYLGQLTGQVSNEEILGSIFSRFCIGK